MQNVQFREKKGTQELNVTVKLCAERKTVLAKEVSTANLLHTIKIRKVLTGQGINQISFQLMTES